MAQQKALVFNLSTGKTERLQVGDYIDTAVIPQLTNGNAGALVKGTPVYVSANDTVDKGRANAVGTVNVIGLIADTSVAAAGIGGVQMEGNLVATTAEWDVICGTTGGLTKDVTYFLSATTAGKLVSDISAYVAGNFAISIGTAISTTEMKIEIQSAIKL